jgi:hypothetical protein
MDNGVGHIGSTSHNARVVQLKKFVSAPPHGGKNLRLVVTGESGETLGAWTREECEGHPEVAEEASALLEAHCEATEQDVEAVLGWERDNLPPVTKRLRAKSKTSPISAISNLNDTAAAVGAITEGTMASVVVQLLRKDELNTRTYLQGFMYQLKQSAGDLESAREANNLLQSNCMQLHQGQFELMQKASQLLVENLELRARVDVLERENAELRGDTPSEVVGPETDAARAELIKQGTDAIVKVAPEAWGMFKAYMWQQAQEKAQAQARATAAAAASSNGNGHAAAE